MVVPKVSYKDFISLDHKSLLQKDPLYFEKVNEIIGLENDLPSLELGIVKKSSGSFPQNSVLAELKKGIEWFLRQ